MLFSMKSSTGISIKVSLASMASLFLGADD
jgi:hypothetical protein